MNRWLPLFVLTGLTACAASDSARVETEPVADSTQAQVLSPPAAVACAPATTTPTYVRPQSDAVALSTLIDGAGYGSSSNSGWQDITSGDFCGGAEKELLLLKNTQYDFSVLRGPTPYPVAAFDFVTSPSQPWRSVAAGNLDGDAFDEIVALRNVTSTGVPDLVVAKADPKSCFLTTPLAQATLGKPGNSDWIDAAVGNFDGGKTKKIALLKSGHSNLFLVQYAAGALTTVATSDLDTSASYPWKALAAGDLDGDGIDELVAARQVSDGRGATVLAYKWTGTTFNLFATSTFGNTGNSAWAGMTIGDFNGDKRGAIVLTKNAHSNFAVLDLPTRGTTLRVAKTSDLDSVAGQDWRGVTAVDWLGTDGGAAELVAVRAAQDPYRSDLFVYGNGYHRLQRDSGITDVKGAWDQVVGQSTENLKKYLTDTHANTLSWTLTLPTDYMGLVQFLKDTQGFCVDGRQLRVWATLAPPSAVGDGSGCPLPLDVLGLTPWDEALFFSEPLTGDPATICKDYLGWGSAFGRLAQEYPHFVAVQIDDFMNNPNDVPVETIAEMQSRMRSPAPWMSLLLETYSNNVASAPPDIGRTVDSLLFYFRNDLVSTCIAGTCGEQSVWGAPRDIALVQTLLPAGRKLHLGSYWDGLAVGKTWQIGTPRYNFDLLRLMMSLPNIGGFQQYPQMASPQTPQCDEFNFTSDKFCILQRLYGGMLRPTSHTDLTVASGAPQAGGEPFGFVYPQGGVQNIAYRGTDNHAHELWRTATGIGHSDLTALAGAPPVLGDVRAYVYDPAATQNVVYRGTDGNVHGLYWTTGPVRDDNLTALAGAPLAAGAPYPYVYPAANTQNVLYRGTDGHVHGLYWTTGAVRDDDLSNLAHAPNALGDPSAYIYDAFGMQNALYRAADGQLHDLWWSFGAVSNDNLTGLAAAPAPAADARAYITTNDNLQHAIYGGTDGHVHELYWSTGAVGHDDLTNATHAPSPALGATPAGYFVASDGTQHVVYRDALAHVRELTWTVGGVSDDDLTGVTYATLAAGDPSAYVATDGSRHVVYRGVDGHIHEIVH